MTGIHPPRPSLFPGYCGMCGQADDLAIHSVAPMYVAVARRTDPDTSWQAARSLGDLRDSQAEILELFRRYGPMTDEEARSRYQGRQSLSGFRTRRSELVDRGLLRDTGERRRMTSGRRGVVWGVA